MPARPNLARRIVRLLSGGMLLAFASCSGSNADVAGRAPVFPVQGEVTVQGKPAENALVVFHPAGGELPGGLRPNGRTDPDGKFTLSTYDSGDGAPAGEYKVTVIVPEKKTPSGPNPDPDLAADRLKGRYANPATSKLQARVEEKDNLLAPFAVK